MCWRPTSSYLGRPARAWTAELSKLRLQSLDGAEPTPEGFAHLMALIAGRTPLRHLISPYLTFPVPPKPWRPPVRAAGGCA